MKLKMSECVPDNTEVGIESTTEREGHSEQQLDANEKVILCLYS